MSKILETHYNLTNHSSQVRIIEENFIRYVNHLIKASVSGDSSKIIHSSPSGPTLAKPERITAIVHYTKDKSLTFIKKNDYTNDDIVVSLVKIEQL